MAVVRLNKALRGTIITNAELQMRPAIDRANALIPSGSEWGEKAYRIMFQQELPMIEQAPDNWFKHKTEIEIRGLVSEDFRVLQLKLTSPVRWPDTVVENDFIEPAQYGYGSVQVKPHPAWDGLRAAYRTYREAFDAAHSRKTTYVRSVEKIIDTYSTLAPALKAWPPLWDLLPLTAQNEHHRVDTPRKREEKDIDVDFSTLTSISTAAKFGV
jgi:hypothetical protein